DRGTRVDTDVERWNFGLCGDRIEGLSGKGNGLIRPMKGEHHAVADLLDELALVLERERSDHALQSRQRLHRALVALGMRALGERLEVEEDDRGLDRPALSWDLAGGQVKVGILDAGVQEVLVVDCLHNSVE